jgi:hypothetical protein
MPVVFGPLEVMLCPLQVTLATCAALPCATAIIPWSVAVPFVLIVVSVALTMASPLDIICSPVLLPLAELLVLVMVVPFAVKVTVAPGLGDGGGPPLLAAKTAPRPEELTMTPD